jgi:hypothetical protein
MVHSDHVVSQFRLSPFDPFLSMMYAMYFSPVAIEALTVMSLAYDASHVKGW